MLRHKAALGTDRDNDRVLHLLRLDQAEYFGAVVLRSVRPTQAASRYLAEAQMQTFDARALLGGALLGQKKYADAEPCLRQGFEGMKQRQKAIPAQYATALPEALDRLIELETARNRSDELRKWRAERATYPGSAAPPP